VCVCVCVCVCVYDLPQIIESLQTLIQPMVGRTSFGLQQAQAQHKMIAHRDVVYLCEAMGSFIQPAVVGERVR